jgi:hypothetical protein
VEKKIRLKQYVCLRSKGRHNNMKAYILSYLSVYYALLDSMYLLQHQWHPHWEVVKGRQPLENISPSKQF